MRNLIFIIFVIFNSVFFSQTFDPYKFFPSAVGNIWEYDQVWDFAREELYKDSIGENEYRYLFYKYNDYYNPTPLYKIDITLTHVYRVPFNPSNQHWLYFKLDSDIGDVWIVDSLEVDSNKIYQLALCRNQYEGFFFNYYTTFKEITFYQYQADTVLNEFSWPDYTITLAYGIGEVMNFDEEGGPQRVLQGCIIDGDTIGIITSVKDDFVNLNSFELYQNYPNPFNPSTIIQYKIHKTSFVKLKVYDILGNEETVLVDEEKPLGNYTIEFNTDKLKQKVISSGTYFYELYIDGYRKVKKMSLIK